jgi:hypothetical protein
MARKRVVYAVWFLMSRAKRVRSGTCGNNARESRQPAIKGPGPAAFDGVQQGQSDYFTRIKFGLRVFRDLQHLLVHSVEQCDNEIVGSHRMLLSVEALQPLQLEHLYGYLSNCAFIMTHETNTIGQ